jgi:hypothetical protein
MAQKKVGMDATLKMVPACHPEAHFVVLYIPERGGDRIHIKCPECYRIFFSVKLPKEES